MKKLHKLTLLSFIGPFVVTFFVCLFVLLMQFLFKYIDDLVGKGLEWYIVAELMVYASAHLVPLALPLAVLLSSLMAFGNLAENIELTAMKASGISLFRIMIPLMFVVMFISFAAFAFSNGIIPQANLKFRALLWDVRQQKPAFDIQEGVFYNDLEGYSIRVSEKPDGHTLKDILIYDFSEGRGNVNVMRAEHGLMEITPDERWLVLRLYNGVRYEDMPEEKNGPPTFPHNRLWFSEYEILFDLSDFQLERTDESLFSHHYEMLNIFELQYYIDSMNNQLDKRTRDIRNNAARYLSTLNDPLFREHKEDTINPGRQGRLNRFFPEIRADSLVSGKIKNAVANPKADTGNTKTDPDTIVESSVITDTLEQIPVFSAEIHRVALDDARSVSNILDRHARDVRHIKERKIRYELEWHRRFTLSIACFMLFIIGAPLGAIVGKGGLGMPTVLSVLLFIFFHILSISYEKLAREAIITPLLGMWIPIFIIFPIGLFLTWQANRDSIIFSKELYGWILRKFQSKKSGP